MKKKKKSLSDIDKEVAYRVYADILEMIDGSSVYYSLEYIYGIVVALVRFISIIKNEFDEVELSDKDCLEKMVLASLSVSDAKSGLSFSKYIDIGKESFTADDERTDINLN